MHEHCENCHGNGTYHSESYFTNDRGRTEVVTFAIHEPTDLSAELHMDDRWNALYGKTFVNTSRRDICKGYERHTRHNFLGKWWTPPVGSSNTFDGIPYAFGATHKALGDRSDTPLHKGEKLVENSLSPSVFPPNAMGSSARSGNVVPIFLEDTIPLKSSEHREKCPRSSEPLYSGGSRNLIGSNSALAMEKVCVNLPDENESKFTSK